MIIVSQDKTMLLNFENIEVIGMGNEFQILVETTSDNQYPIAVYRTEERAKEILEEIVKCKTGMFAVLYERPMCEGEKIEKAKLNKRMLDKLNNIVIDSGGKIETLQGTKVYYMPEE